MRFTSNSNLPCHLIFIEGVYRDRSAQGLKPKFVKIDPPSDADIAKVVHQISQRVIRTLRKLGYLESGIDATVATGYDPLVDEEPELARTMAASVQQRIAFGERAGQKVRRIGSGFGHEGGSPTLTGTRCASVHGFSLHAGTHIPAHRRDQLERLIRYTARGAVSLERLGQDPSGDLIYTFTRPWSDGTTGIKLSPLERLEKLATLVPPPRVHQVRYGGCLAPPSKLRGAIIPTRRQQGASRCPAPSRLAGAGRGCSSACLPSTWHDAPGVTRAPCASSPLSPTGRSLAGFCALSNSRLTPRRPWLRRAWSKRVSPGPLPTPALFERGCGPDAGPRCVRGARRPLSLATRVTRSDRRGAGRAIICPHLSAKPR